MPLTNFGSILNFAEEIEHQDQQYYQAAAANPASADHKRLFEQGADDLTKNMKTIQRTRRENVTEMILEGIQGFSRESYLLSGEAADRLTADELLAAARRRETRAIRYYGEAAEKLKALPEVARALKQLAKKHKAFLDRLGA